MLEGTNASEGRGTTRPFELFGAPWVDAKTLMGALDPADFPGLGLRAVGFKPMFQKHAGTRCGGLQLHVREAGAVRSLRSSIALLRALWALGYTQGFGWRTKAYEFVDDIPAIDLLAGGTWMREGVEAGESTEAMVRSMDEDRAAFLKRRRAFLRY